MHDEFDAEHEHTHTHTHEHTHDGVTHTHEHVHAHEHGGDPDTQHASLHGENAPHEHEHSGSTDDKETIALLDFMLHHNMHHVEELEELAGKLREIGKGEAAERISAATTLFEQGNAELSEALMLVSE